MSPFRILLELRVTEVVVTTGAIKHSSQNVTTNKPTLSFFTDRMPFLSPNQQGQSTDGNKLILNIVGKTLFEPYRVN